MGRGCDQVLLRFQHDVRWIRDDLPAPCEPFHPPRRDPLLGDPVATHQQTQGGLVPCRRAGEQHEQLVWLQGLLIRAIYTSPEFFSPVIS